MGFLFEVSLKVAVQISDTNAVGLLGDTLVDAVGLGAVLLSGARWNPAISNSVENILNNDGCYDGLSRSRNAAAE